MTIKVPATIEKIETLADGSIRLKVGTQELGAEDATELFEQRGKLGWMLFSPNTVSEAEVPEESAKEFKTDKTPSQRLRAVLYAAWQQRKPGGDWQDYYERQMGRIIEYVKDKLLS